MTYPTIAEVLNQEHAPGKPLPPSYHLQHEAANDAAELRAGIDRERQEFERALLGWDPVLA